MKIKIDWIGNRWRKYKAKNKGGRRIKEEKCEIIKNNQQMWKAKDKEAMREKEKGKEVKKRWSEFSTDLPDSDQLT